MKSSLNSLEEKGVAKIPRRSHVFHEAAGTQRKPLGLGVRRPEIGLSHLKVVILRKKHKRNNTALGFTAWELETHCLRWNLE